MKIFILGSGGWGLAASTLLHNNGHQVTIWSFRPEEAALLNNKRENPQLLPGVILPDGIKITTELWEVKDAEIVIMATPSYAVFETAEKIYPYVHPSQTMVLLSKGFDNKNGSCLLTDTLNRVFEGKLPIVALTGPSHAEEVARQLPTAVVAASDNKSAAELVQSVFMNGFFRVYTTPDIIGAQLGGAMKNVIALASGIADGAGYGDNTRAMLMTRGMAEMARFGVYLGGRNETFSGLSGIGDLIVTCTSNHSRNHRAGVFIGQGIPVEEALVKVGAVVEGYYATKAVHDMASTKELDLPICRAMYDLLFEGADLHEIVKSLFARDKRQEINEIWMKHISW